MTKKKPNIKKFAIQNLTKVPSKNHPDSKMFWPREMKLMNSLWARYPDEEFWLNLTLPWTLNSLAFLKSGRGSQELERKYNEYTYTPPDLEKPTELGDKKVGKDKKITKGRIFLDEL